ncbi:hypothetical protein Dimus_024204, partial [Dionaea muscipula]
QVRDGGAAASSIARESAVTVATRGQPSSRDGSAVCSGTPTPGQRSRAASCGDLRERNCAAAARSAVLAGLRANPGSAFAAAATHKVGNIVTRWQRHPQQVRDVSNSGGSAFSRSTR